MTKDEALFEKFRKAKDSKLSLELKEGETYIGAIINADGTGNHIVLLPGDEQFKWNDGLQWAKEQGGDLPNRVEQAILFDKFKSEFKEDWYWSNTQHAANADYAWYQYFHYGTQDICGKRDTMRVRAVRRFLI